TAGSFPATPTAATPPTTGSMDPLSSDPPTVREPGGTPGTASAAEVTTPGPIVGQGEEADPQGAGEAVPVTDGFAVSTVGESASASARDVRGGAENSVDPFAPVAMGESTPDPALADEARQSGEEERVLPPPFKTSLDRIEPIGPDTRSAGYDRTFKAYMAD